MRYLRNYSMFNEAEISNVGSFMDGMKSIIDRIFKQEISETSNWVINGGQPEEVKKNIIKMFTDVTNLLISNFDKKLIKKEEINTLYNDFIAEISNYKLELVNSIKGSFDKEKSRLPIAISSKILDVLINTIQNTDFKKKYYDDPLAEASKGKAGDEIFTSEKSKLKDIFREIQTVINNAIPKINDDDLKNLVSAVTVTPELVKKWMREKTKIKYKLQGYIDTVPVNSQLDKVGNRAISSFDEEKGLVTFVADDGEKFQKQLSEIIGPSSDNNQIISNLKDQLGKIKDDKTKMLKVASFVNFVNKNINDKNKMNQINTIINSK
jgi:hypothetical protein